MSFSKGKKSVSIEEILNKVSESDIAFHYLNIDKIPCFINSPLRKDTKASFGIYTKDKSRIYWTDLATKDRGGIFDLLCLLWGCSLIKVLERIKNDIETKKFSSTNKELNHLGNKIKTISTYSESSDLECKTRDWEPHDIEYWNSYGISLEWLKYADVYPVSHKIIVKGNRRYVFKADKYAYAYVERKEGRVTIKLYQPFNTNGYKWCNKHDSSVIGLWCKVPKKGERIAICSSIKDALCLWSNTGIPSLAIQGEGYNISNTAINELKKRYKSIFIILDNDKAGIEDAIKLSKSTGFTNITLPKFNGGKDISDLYKCVGKEKFIAIVKPLFDIKDDTKSDNSEIPYY